MDNMLKHPGTELQLLIKEKGLTQKAFSSILGKKVSEVNELLKGKRNITIQRDYLLHQTLGTPIKYWILKQVDYDYSLLDIEDISLPVRGAADPEGNEGKAEGLSESHSHSKPEEHENLEISSPNKEDTAKPMEFEQPQEASIKEPDSKDDEDLKNRANIFRTF